MTSKTTTYRRDGIKAVSDVLGNRGELSVRGGGRLDYPSDVSWPAVDREIGCSRRVCSAFRKSSRVHGRSILL